MEQLKCVRCNKLFPRVLGPERLMRVHVGFAGGVIRCFVLKPIGLVMSWVVLSGLRRLQC